MARDWTEGVSEEEEEEEEEEEDDDDDDDDDDEMRILPSKLEHVRE